MIVRPTMRPRLTNFSPKMLSPVYWFDSSDLNTLFDATSGGSTPVNGGGVARWEDKSGNGRHLTQPTALSRPVRTDALQNGKTGLGFDNGDDVMAGPRFDLTAATCFMVVSRLGIGKYQTILTHTQASIDEAGLNVSVHDDPFYGPVMIGSRASPSTLWGKGGLLRQNEPRILTAKWLGGTVEGAFNYLCRDNGAAVSLVNSSAVGGAPQTSTMVGVSFGGGIFEIILCNAVLSATQVSQTEAYLSAKWGIPLV